MSREFAILDLENVRIAFEDDDAGLIELLDLVASTARNDLTALQAAIAARDRALAAKLAHGLKGSTSNVGAQEFASVCEQLERDLQTADWDAGGARFAELERAFRRLRDSIEDFRTASTK